MSYNREIYDTNNYKLQLQESVSTLDYILSPFRYEHNDKCRHQLGLLGGTDVSHIKGNIVDLESDLRGQTRLLSKYGGSQYIPTNDNIITNDKTAPIDTTMLHLPACQTIMYRAVPIPKKLN